MTNVFGNIFNKHLILEQDEMTDQTAMQQALDPGTDSSDFDVDGGASQDALAALAQHEQQKIETLKQWIGDLENFVEILNGTGPESMQTKLKNASPDSVFGKVAKGETRTLTRAAMELSSLAEGLKGYLASASNPLVLRGNNG